MNELPEEILNRLDALAQVTGTSIEVLWSALVKGGFAVGLTAIIQMAICLPVLLCAAVGLRWASNYTEKDKYDSTAGGITAISILLAVIAFGAMLALSFRLVYIFAPELYAAEKMLGIVQ